MAVESTLTTADAVAILANYECGTIEEIRPLTAGTVQTNLLVRTMQTNGTQGKFVLRYYRQNRSLGAVCFEAALINYLHRHNYPCPPLLRRRQGDYVGLYREHPYALFDFLEGLHLAYLTAAQQQQLIQAVAELQRLTHSYRPPHWEERWHYDEAFCERMAAERAAAIGTPKAAAKLAWYRQQLAQLILPATHPKGICHTDFHESNLLFQKGNFHALLDFDDANYTYLTFDLVSLLAPVLFRFQWDSWQTVRPTDAPFDFAAARQLLAPYEAVRPLSDVEKAHLFDVLKLATLVDCLWYFARGEVGHFYEGRKIDCLDALGRARFYQALFGTQ